MSICQKKLDINEQETLGNMSGKADVCLESFQPKKTLIYRSCQNIVSFITNSFTGKGTQRVMLCRFVYREDIDEYRKVTRMYSTSRSDSRKYKCFRRDILHEYASLTDADLQYKILVILQGITIYDFLPLVKLFITFLKQ